MPYNRLRRLVFIDLDSEDIPMVKMEPAVALTMTLLGNRGSTPCLTQRSLSLSLSLSLNTT